MGEWQSKEQEDDGQDGGGGERGQGVDRVSTVDPRRPSRDGTGLAGPCWGWGLGLGPPGERRGNAATPRQTLRARRDEAWRGVALSDVSKAATLRHAATATTRSAAGAWAWPGPWCGWAAAAVRPCRQGR